MKRLVNLLSSQKTPSFLAGGTIQSGKDVPDFPKRNRGYVTSILVASFIVGYLLAFLNMYKANVREQSRYDANRTFSTGGNDDR